MPCKQSISELVRRFYRTYRNCSIPLGHSLLRRVLRLCLAQNQEVRLQSGLRLQLDLSKGNQEGIFWDDGAAETQLWWAIRELVPPGGLFVDCGANCGLMGLLASQYRRARVLFIEPHPRLARSIEANVRLNNFEDRAEVIQSAVSDASGESVFYENPTADGSHSIHENWGEGEMRLLGKVKCERLEDILQTRNMQRIDFLKIDTEGNDLAVLKGLGPYLRPSLTPLIYVEMGRDQEGILRLMDSRGYAGYVAFEKRRRAVVRRRNEYEKGGRVSFFRRINDSPW